jgi:hypothetical protein
MFVLEHGSGCENISKQDGSLSLTNVDTAINNLRQDNINQHSVRKPMPTKPKLLHLCIIHICD